MLWWTLFVLSLRAVEPLPAGYVSYRAETPVRIDGKIDEQWSAAPWTSDFVDIEGHRKPQPRFRTRAKMMWDERYFYIAAELSEPHVWGTLKRHDSVIFHDNDFEVFLDPNGDSHEYFEFEINALNTSWDLFLPKPYKDGGRAENAWDIPGLRTAVDVRGTRNKAADVDHGWSVEIAIPWAAFGDRARMPLSPTDGQQWRVNFSRVEWQHEIDRGRYRKVKGTKEDNWVWSPQYVVDMHWPEMWGYVQFSGQTRGAVEFRPDRTWVVRQRLQTYYRKQKDFFKGAGRWGTDPEVPVDAGLQLIRTASGWQACLERLCIRSDSRVEARIGE